MSELLSVDHNRFPKPPEVEAEVIRQFEDKSGKNFYITNGLSDELIDQLVGLSRNDENILKWCPDDSTRFSSAESYRDWQNKNKTIKVFALVSEQGDLVGLSWVHDDLWPLSEPSPQNKFAIRIYGDSGHKGLGHELMDATLHQTFDNDSDRVKCGLWLSVHRDNSDAFNLFFRNGIVFKESDPDYQDYLIMQYWPPAVAWRKSLIR
jgi:hypothetical protein